MRGVFVALVALVSLPLATLSGFPSYASVEETIHECVRLYRARNNFYHQRKLCFTRPGAIRQFPDNPSTCRYSNSEDLPISASEKRVIDRIVARERELGCEAIRP
jgi:hypothetical protein